MLRFVKIFPLMKKNVTQTAQASMGGKPESQVKSLPAASAQIRIPTQRPVPQLNHHIKRTTQQVTKEWTPEVTHTDRVSSYLSPEASEGQDLSHRRIERFHQRKTASLLRKIAELHEASSRKVDNKVSRVDEEDAQKKKENDSDELWRDMIKPHVERHFQIGRITNFFT